MEPTLLFNNLGNINIFSRINDYVVANEIQMLCIGFFSTTLIYFLILTGFMLKNRYRNFTEAFFLSLSIGGAIFMLSVKVFPVLAALFNTSLIAGPYIAILLIIGFYAL